MANTTLHIPVGLAGLTGLTFELHTLNSDTARAVADNSLTELTNDNGTYSGTVDTAINKETVKVNVFTSGGALVGKWFVYLLDTTATFTAGELSDVGNSTNLLAEQLVTIFGGVSGTVVDDASNSTTTFETDLTETTDDFYGDSNGGAVCVMTSGENIGLARRVSDYDGTTKFVTVESAFPSEPAAGDTFILIGRIEI